MSVISQLRNKATWTIAGYLRSGFSADAEDEGESQPATARDVLRLLDSDSLASASSLCAVVQRGECEHFFADALLVPLEALTSTIDSSECDKPMPRDVARDIRLAMVAADVVAREVQTYTREREASPWWPPACKVPYADAAAHLAAMVAATGIEPPRIAPEHTTALGFQNYCGKCLDALGHSGESVDCRVVVDESAPAILVGGKRMALANIFEARALQYLATHPGFLPQADLIEIADPPAIGKFRRTARPSDWFRRSTSEVFRRFTETRDGGGIAFKQPA